MTVIFSNAGDEDCLTIKRMWEGIPNVNVIEYTKENETDDQMYDKLQNAISNEKDYLILCGHGSPEGLFSPTMTRHIFHRFLIPLVEAKNVLCIWCWADEFCKKYKFKSLTSSMFISNQYEAYYHLGQDAPNQEGVNETNIKIYDEIREHLLNGSTLEETYNSIQEGITPKDAVDTFNRKGFKIIE